MDSSAFEGERGAAASQAPALDFDFEGCKRGRRVRPPSMFFAFGGKCALTPDGRYFVEWKRSARSEL